MTLGNILNHYVKNGADVYIPITYRTIITSDGTDVFAGFCRYENGKLISEDGDNYSLEDEIIKYEMKLDNNINGTMQMHLTVWYESEWITDDNYG